MVRKQVLQQDDIQSLLNLHGAGRLAEAEAKSLLSAFPEAVILHNILAATYAAQNKMNEAAECFRRALEIDPDAAEGHYNYGIALQGLGRTEDAVTCYERAVSLKPEYAEAHNNLGVALHDLKRSEEAIESYHRALQIAPDYAESHNNLAVLYLDLERPGDAEASCRQAVQYKPDYAEAHNNLGIALQNLGKFEDAIGSHCRALELQPRYAEAFSNLGYVQKASGRFEEALENYQAALRLNPRLLTARYGYGNLLLECNRLDESAETLRALLDSHPDHAESHNDLGVICGRLASREEAISHFRKALASRPEFVEARINLAHALLDAEELDEAIEAFRMADPEMRRTDVNAILLECYFRKRDRTAFDIHLQMLKARQKRFNFRAVAAATFSAQQYGSRNAYSFCDNPIDFVSIFNPVADQLSAAPFVQDLASEADRMRAKEQIEPNLADSSTGNVFETPDSHFAELECIFRHDIDAYHRKHATAGNPFIEGWPASFKLHGKLVRLHKDIEAAAQVRPDECWLSGLFFFDASPQNDGDEDNIEFTLRGYELPVLRADFPTKLVETRPGTLVLFPPSLPYRVVPYSSDDVRICIAFDVVPC